MAEADGKLADVKYRNDTYEMCDIAYSFGRDILAWSLRCGVTMATSLVSCRHLVSSNTMPPTLASCFFKQDTRYHSFSYVCSRLLTTASTPPASACQLFAPSQLPPTAAILQHSPPGEGLETPNRGTRDLFGQAEL